MVTATMKTDLQIQIQGQTKLLSQDEYANLNDGLEPPDVPENQASLFSSTIPVDPVASTLNKKGRNGNESKRSGWIGVQKPKSKPRQRKDKQVRFKTPLAEIQLIDFEASIVPGSDNACITSAAVVATVSKCKTRARAGLKEKNVKKEKDRQTMGGKKVSSGTLQASVFGTNHVPRRYGAVAQREAELQASEPVDSFAPYTTSAFLILVDAATSLSFSVPLSCVEQHPNMLSEVKAHAQAHPGEQLVFRFEKGTPAGVFLYSHALTLGKINKYHVEMAWKVLVERHRELGIESWMAVLLSGLVVAREAEHYWFEKVVVDEVVKASEENIGVVA